MIVCGWCGLSAPVDGPCPSCFRNPRLFWEQRGLEPPTVADAKAGRPALKPSEIRQRLGEAEKSLRDSGQRVTVTNLADILDVSPATVRRWRGI